MALEDTRWARNSPPRRSHYGAVQRMRILRLRAARSWTVARTAERFLVTEDTIANWTRRLDERGAAAPVRLEESVDEFPDYAAHLVRRSKVLSPTLGKVRIARMLARAGLHSSANRAARIQTPSHPRWSASGRSSGLCRMTSD